MTNEDQAERTIGPEGGAYAGGDANVEGGDLVGHDQIQHVDGPLATGGGDAVDLREAQAPVVGATGPVDVQIGDRYYLTAPPERRIPLQRPARATHFVGRKQELDWLLAELHPGRVVTLCGPGGIGKSALAAEAIWTLAPDGSPPDRFPDGIVTHSFYRQPQAAVAMEAICRAYGEEPRPTPKVAARRALAGRRALLYLDGTEGADDLPSVLEVRGECGVLVTSRRRSDAASHASRHDLAPLPLDEAVQLLQLWGGEHARDRGPSERACDLVGRLPLAVRLVGRYLTEADEDLAAYVAWLEEIPLPALDWGERRQRSMPVLLQRSVAQVSEGAREALAVVGLLAQAPFGWGTVAAATASAEAQVRRPLAELVDYGLLLREDEYYQVSHALVHTYARECCSPPAGAVERLAAYYTALAKEQSALEAEGYRRLDSERAQLMRMVEESTTQQNWQDVLDLVWAIRQYFDAQGLWTDLGAAIRHRLKASRQLCDLSEEANCISRLGEVHLQLSEYPEARQCYEEARPIYAQIGDRPGEANCIRALGEVHRRMSEYPEAQQRFEEARTIYAQIGDRLGEANCIRSLGEVHRLQAEYPEARQCFEEAGTIFAQIGDRLGEANCILRLGDLHRLQAEYPEARQRYEKARPIYAQVGVRLGEASCIWRLGDLHLQLSEYPEARQCYEEARPIYAQIGDRLGEANCVKSLGDVHLRLDEYQEAWDRYEEACTTFAQVGDRLGEANCIRSLGDVHLRLDEYQEARQRYEKAGTIYAQIGARLGEANCIRSLGDVHLRLSEYPEARQRYEKAYPIFAQIGDRLGEANCIKSLGDVHLRLDEYQEARQRFEEAGTIFAQIGHRDSYATTLLCLGLVYHGMGKKKRARQCLRDAASIFEEFGSPHTHLIRQGLDELEMPPIISEG